MIELKVYDKTIDVPPLTNQQVIDFLRMQWPDGFQGANRLRNWAHNEEWHPVHFNFIEENILISHVAVVWKHIAHKEVSYKVYAPSGMMTYPQFRRQGYGLKLMRAAKEYMLTQDPDILLVHSGLTGFYEKLGFEPLPKVSTLVGNPNKPTISDEKAFGLFITDKGKRGRADFESQPFYFGEDLW